MRTDIPAYIISKTEQYNQTVQGNANPKIALVIKRKQTYADEIDQLEKRRARRASLNELTDVGVAVEHPTLGGEDEGIWVTYIEDGKLSLRRGSFTSNLVDMSWVVYNLGTISAVKCDVVLPSTADEGRVTTEYVTERYPYVFYLDSAGKIRKIDMSETEDNTEVVVDGGCVDLSVRRGPVVNDHDSGICLFYLKTDGYIYYKLYQNGTWGSQVKVNLSLPSSDTMVSFNAFDLEDGIGLCVYGNAGKMYQTAAQYDTTNNSFTFGSFLTVCDADCEGAAIAYFDGHIETFYSRENLCCKIANPTDMYPWSSIVYGEEIPLYDKQYAVVDADHRNRGKVYLITLIHGDSHDALYLFRYMYWDDVSNYVESANMSLQVDNAIVQTSVTMKNVNDSLYTSDATLFAPSAKLELGVSYGNSDIVPMAIAYIDEVDYQHGSKNISLSGRNNTGVYLHDQTFDEDMKFVGTPSEIHEAIFEYFGIEDYEVDTYADTTPITLEVEAGDTGISALEDLASMLSDNVEIGLQWKLEERYDGLIVAGFDEFRRTYIPKGSYQFNGMNDVFTKSVSRCIDGAYTKVRCTGVTPDGKDISYVMDVPAWRFWNPGEHKTYHADKIEGITSKNLKKYAKALTKQLKYVGRVINYSTTLRPQLLVGDIAKIVGEDGEYEKIGTITEITHNFGASGYTTDFVISSGGNTEDVSGAAYTADIGLDGANRNRRLTDYMQSGKTSSRSYSGSWSGSDFDYIEDVRNAGGRFLDEPTDVSAEYKENNNTIELKWTDPDDLTTLAPIACIWAGTVVVRSNKGLPRHIWDGTIIVDSTTKNQYSQTALVDNDIQKSVIYYYGIFPYYVTLDDSGNPIKCYRATKKFSIVAGSDLEQPVIKKITVNGLDATIKYSVATLSVGTYAVCKLVGKKDGIPSSVTDGDVIIDISPTGTSQSLTNLDPLTTYCFVIFVEDSQGNKASSDPVNCTTGVANYVFFEKAYMGIVKTANLITNGTYNYDVIKDNVNISSNRVTYAKPSGATFIDDINEQFASYIGSDKTLCAYMKASGTNALYYLSNGVFIRRIHWTSGGMASTMAIPLKRIYRPRKLTYAHKNNWLAPEYNVFYVSLGVINSSGLIQAISDGTEIACNTGSSYKTETIIIPTAGACDYLIIQAFGGEEDIKDIVISYIED